MSRKESASSSSLRKRPTSSTRKKAPSGENNRNLSEQTTEMRVSFTIRIAAMMMILFLIGLHIYLFQSGVFTASSKAISAEETSEEIDPDSYSKEANDARDKTADVGNTSGHSEKNYDGTVQEPNDEVQKSLPHPRKQYKLLQRIYHDPNAFTQGLTYHNGALYEGTGLYSKSEIRRLDPNTGHVYHRMSMEPSHFGEGLTLFDKGQRLIQLTWRENVGFIYNSTTLDVIQTFNFVTHTREGWGITHDDFTNTFIVSDGSEWLCVWDDTTLEELRRICVTLPNGEPVWHINELEFVNNSVLANVWYSDVLISIDPVSGLVEKIFNFSELWPHHQRPDNADCFNGISRTDVEDEIFVTGKNWPYMYRVKLLD